MRPVPLYRTMTYGLLLSRETPRVIVERLRFLYTGLYGQENVSRVGGGEAEYKLCPFHKLSLSLSRNGERERELAVHTLWKSGKQKYNPFFSRPTHSSSAVSPRSPCSRLLLSIQTCPRTPRSHSLEYHSFFMPTSHSLPSPVSFLPLRSLCPWHGSCECLRDCAVLVEGN